MSETKTPYQINMQKALQNGEEADRVARIEFLLSIRQAGRLQAAAAEKYARALGWIPRDEKDT